MSTTPVVPAPTFDWKSLINVVELAGNVAVGILIPGGATFVPLLTGLENAINPLLQSIGTKPSVSNEVMTSYATIIGILTTLKQVPGLAPDVLAKIDSYMIAAENGTASYLQASQGFNPANEAPVTPIV